MPDNDNILNIHTPAPTDDVQSGPASLACTCTPLQEGETSSQEGKTPPQEGETPPQERKTPPQKRKSSPRDAVEQNDLIKEVRNKFEETFNDKHPWTLYLLIDLEVVYIITFGLVSVVNLISSTASIRASSDKNSMLLFNVSSKYMNVNVTSINDAVLWNCRKLSDSSNYYKTFYWMVIIALATIMGIFF